MALLFFFAMVIRQTAVSEVTGKSFNMMDTEGFWVLDPYSVLRGRLLRENEIEGKSIGLIARGPSNLQSLFCTELDIINKMVWH